MTPIPLLVAAFLLTSGSTAAEPIVLDGRFDDWRDVPVAVSDPADAPDADVDFLDVHVVPEHRFVHLLVETGRPVNLQKLRGRIELLVDLDDSADTGTTVRAMPGVDVILEFTPPDRQRGDRPGEGVGIAVPTDQPPPGDRMRLPGPLLGIAFAPTYASDRFEVRFVRAPVPEAPPWPVHGQFAARLDFFDARGTVRDETEVFRQRLAPTDPIEFEQTEDPLARAPGTDLRVVNWNVEFGSIFEAPDRFTRVLAALDPDVILLQELVEENTASQLANLLNRAVPDRGGRGQWQALVGAGGGDLRSGLAARGSLRALPAADPLPYPDRPARSIRIAAAELTRDGRRVLLASLHLRCCGYAGSFEDRTRSLEAETLRRTFAAAIETMPFDAIIIGGDLNLVGARHPLDVLVAGTDVDGSGLATADPLQLDQRTNATWSDNRLPFAPGRLDFLLYGDASLRALGGFVLETIDLEARWRRQYGLLADDSIEASDHLPVVVDLSFVDER